MSWIIATILNIEYIDSRKYENQTNLVITTESGPCIIPMLTSEVSNIDLDKMLKEKCPDLTTEEK